MPYWLRSAGALRRFAALLAFLGTCCLPAWAQQTAYSADGTYTVPAGVTSLKVILSGGGGGGGGADAVLGENGGSGAQATGFVTVTPGAVLTVRVGRGGVGGRNGTGAAAAAGAGGAGWQAGGGGGIPGGVGVSASGAGGGGASAVLNGATLLIAAGGGGGGGSGSNSPGGTALAGENGGATGTVTTGSPGATGAAFPIGSDGSGGSGGGGGCAGGAAAPAHADLTAQASNAKAGTSCIHASLGTGLTATAAGGAGGTRQATNSTTTSGATGGNGLVTIIPAPSLSIRKTSVGNVGTFAFTLAGVNIASDSVTTASSGTAVTSSQLSYGTDGTLATVTETAATSTGAGYSTAISCTDSNSAFTGNATAITSATTAVTIPAANMKWGAVYTCAYTNTYRPNIAVTKTDGNTTSYSGYNSIYTITVTNTGLASTVTLGDAAVTGMTKGTIACGSTPGVCTAATLPTVANLEAGTFVTPSIPNGGSYQFTVSANVTATSGSLSNVVTATTANNLGAACTAAGSSFTAGTGACAATDTNTVSTTMNPSCTSNSALVNWGTPTGSGGSFSVIGSTSSGVTVTANITNFGGGTVTTQGPAFRTSRGTGTSNSVIVYSFSAPLQITEYRLYDIDKNGTSWDDTYTINRQFASCSTTGTENTITCGGATSGGTALANSGTPSSTSSFFNSNANLTSMTHTYTAGNAVDSYCMNVVASPLAPIITVAKTTTNGTGSNSFAFTLTGVTNTADTVAVTGAATVESATVHTGTIGTAATVQESGVPANWPVNPVSVSCLDAAAPGNGNVATNLATLSGNTATLPATVMKGNADITCTFTNTQTARITSAKTASANPLLSGASGQFYTVAVDVAGAATTAPLLLADTLPAGMTLDGTPTLIPGTSSAVAGSLTGCPTTGAANTTGCSVASGISAGTFSIRIPVRFAAGTPAAYPAGNTLGANTANLLGGGDAACTTAADACDSSVSVQMANSPRVLMGKSALNAAQTSSTFNFTMTGLSAASDSITILGDNTVTSSLGSLTGTAATAVTYTETAPAGWPSGMSSSASCTDANAPGDGNAAGVLAGVTTVGNVVTIPAAAMVRDANISCTLFNARPQVRLTKAIVGTPLDGGLFNLAIAGGNVQTVLTAPKANPATNVGNAGTTDLIGVNVASTLTLTETAGTNTSLANYTSSIACTTAAGVAVTTTGSAGSWTITSPAAGATGNAKIVNCVISNTAVPTVRIAKNSVGGTGTFAFNLTGVTNNTDSVTTTSAGATVTSATVHVGSAGTLATLTETAASSAGYGTAASCVDANSATTGNTGAITSNTSAVTIPAANMKAGAAFTCTFTNTRLAPAVRVIKTTLNGSGSNTFSFALSGLSASADSITVPGNSTVTGSAGVTGTPGQGATITETAPSGWPANPVSASCVDASSTTPAATFGTLSGRQLSIPAASMVAGADIRCTFVNSFVLSVNGRVFIDNGTGAGTPNDGRVNGAEAGLAGVTVRLTDCAATVLATAVTDAAGNYSLAIPSSVAGGATICAQETNAPNYLSTGASIGGAQLPSGQVVSSGGISYVYTRGADSIAFTRNATGHYNVNFGDVPPNLFASGGARTGLSGTTVTYAHTFTAGTGGSVSFGIVSATATPAQSGWSEKIFADTTCSGVLQSGASQIYPPAAPQTVSAGEAVCVIMQEFIPATAQQGNNNAARVKADFTFTNAAPTLSATYTLDDVTTVSSNALDLRKEVRNVTQGGAFGVNNQAKSGETLEYRITYVNNGTGPISALVVSDATPAYTSFVSATAGTTPPTLTACSKNTPANATPAPAAACAAAQAGGGNGPVSWKFTGALDPGGAGEVYFVVKVE